MITNTKWQAQRKLTHSRCLGYMSWPFLWWLECLTIWGVASDLASCSWLTGLRGGVLGKDKDKEGLCWGYSGETISGSYRHPDRVQHLANCPLCWQAARRGCKAGHPQLRRSPFRKTNTLSLDSALSYARHRPCPLGAKYPLDWARGPLEVSGDSFSLPPPTTLMLLLELGVSQQICGSSHSS